jgi:hypothetical protein
MSTPLRTEPSLTDYAAEHAQALDDRIERVYLELIEAAGDTTDARHNYLLDQLMDELDEYEWRCLLREACWQLSRYAACRATARRRTAHLMEDVLGALAAKRVREADQRTLDLGEEGAP